MKLSGRMRLTAIEGDWSGVQYHNTLIWADEVGALEAEVERLEERSRRHLDAHAHSFGALAKISLLTDLGGEVDDYEDVVRAVERLRDALLEISSGDWNEDGMGRIAFEALGGTHGQTAGDRGAVAHD